VGFEVDKVALPSVILPNVPYSCIIWGWYNMPTNDWHIKFTLSHPTLSHELKKKDETPFSYKDLISEVKL
jgi:hypothetical protein